MTCLICGDETEVQQCPIEPPIPVGHRVDGCVHVQSANRLYVAMIPLCARHQDGCEVTDEIWAAMQAA